MGDQPSDPHDHGPFAIDLSVARLARVENFLGGGKAHFAVDRAAVESIGELFQGGLDGLRELVEVVKAFVARAVTVLTGDLGIHQYLHIGMSTPTTGMVHQIAARIAPDTRVVYVSYDPTTLAYVHTLETDARGTVAHVRSAFDDPQTILHQAAATLDFALPMAVVLPTTLNLIPDDETAERIVNELHAAITPGSYLVLAHTSLDIAPEGTHKAIAQFNKILDESYVTRTEAQLTQLLDGFELIEPGLVPAHHWRPDDPTARSNGRPVPIYGAVGRKH